MHIPKDPSESQGVLSQQIRRQTGRRPAARTIREKPSTCPRSPILLPITESAQTQKFWLEIGAIATSPSGKRAVRSIPAGPPLPASATALSGWRSSSVPCPWRPRQAWPRPHRGCAERGQGAAACGEGHAHEGGNEQVDEPLPLKAGPKIIWCAPNAAHSNRRTGIESTLGGGRNRASVIRVVGR